MSLLMISKLFFERWWLLLVLLAMIQIGLLAVWSWRRSHFSTRLVWAGFAAIPLLLLMSSAVVTPRERITKRCRDLAVMVDEGDVAAIGHHLADDFQAAGLGKSAFLDRIEETFTTYQVDHARLRRLEVTFSRPNKGVAVFDAMCRVRSPDANLDRLFSRWRLTFSDDGARWQVTAIEVLPMPLSPIRDIRDCLR